MPAEQDNTQTVLTQIRADFEKALESLEQIKQDADAELLPHLERIEQDGWHAVIEIEKAQKIQGKLLKDTIERNTILGRMPSSLRKPERIGNVRI